MPPRHVGPLAVLLSIAALPAMCGDWNPKLAADYLDGRQKEWFAWKPAMNPGGVCVSCHTNVSYLFARPVLRVALGEATPTTYETGLLDVLRARASKTQIKEISNGNTKEPGTSQALGVEAILSALFLGRESSLGGGAMSADAKVAFDRLWSLSIREGEQAGSWAWFSLKLDPWEMPHSKFYGAALAAMAVGSAPAAYRKQPEVAERVAALIGYFEREQAAQPMHNRLMLLWASTKLQGAMTAASGKKLVDEMWTKQESDGGWAIQSLGPWTEHADAPASNGSNAYATALTAFVLKESGVPASNPRLTRAMDWLRSHQDKGGFWASESMNKKYGADTMPALFMRDAATAYAVLALLDGSGSNRPSSSGGQH